MKFYQKNVTNTENYVVCTLRNFFIYKGNSFPEFTDSKVFLMQLLSGKNRIFNTQVILVGKPRQMFSHPFSNVNSSVTKCSMTYFSFPFYFINKSKFSFKKKKEGTLMDLL